MSALLNVEPKVDATNWLLTILSAVVLVLRVYCKDQRRTPLSSDDYIMFVSWLLLLALTLTCAFAVGHGAGKYLIATTAARTSSLRSSSLADALASTISIAVSSLAKTSVAATLVKNAKGWPRTVAWTTIVVVNVSAGLTGTMLWIQCAPMRKAFEQLDFGYCWPEYVMIIAQAFNSAVSGTADIVLSLTGLYVMYRHTTRQSYRIGAWFCVKFGISAGIAAFTKAALMTTLEGDDTTYKSASIMIWGLIEPATIIIAGSLPELRDLIWRPLQTTRYRVSDEDISSYKRNSLQGAANFDYVMQQYVEPGKQTPSPYRPSRSPARSLRAAEPTWWI